jgi:hypothetical protein
MFRDNGLESNFLLGQHLLACIKGNLRLIFKLKMKLILIATLIALTFAAAGDVTAVAVTASFGNSSALKTGGVCILTVTATCTTIAAATTSPSAIWLINSATQHAVAVNTTIIFLTQAYTMPAAVPVAGAQTGVVYYANAAVTIAAAADVLTATNTATAGTLALGTAATMTVTSWGATVNVSYSTYQYLNSTNAASFFVYQMGTATTTTYINVQATANAVGTTAITISSSSACTDGFAKLSSGVSVTDRILGSILALSFF